MESDSEIITTDIVIPTAEKNEFFARLILATCSAGFKMVDIMADKLKNNDDKNKCLYFIILTCNGLAEINDLLPKDEFQEYINKQTQTALSGITCYIIDNDTKINCNDFYNQNIKRKQINSQILSTVKLQTGGGLGGLLVKIAIGAVVLLQTMSPHMASANLYSNQDFVKQQEQIHGKPGPGFSLVEQHHYADINSNYLGTCTTNALVAEICCGMCPTLAEWNQHDSTALVRIENVYSYDNVDTILKDAGYKPELADDLRKIVLSNKIAPDADLLVGADIAKIYGTRFTDVPAGKGNDPNWFRQHIKSGNPATKLHKPINGADAVIATVINKGHAYNVLYNIVNEAMCVHDPNRNIEQEPSNTDNLQISHNRDAYICEANFFTPAQEARLEKLGNVVKIVSPSENIFKVLGRTDITRIQGAADIFKINNVNHHGSISNFVEIVEDIHEAIIKGEEKALSSMEQNAVKWGLDASKIEVYRDEIDLHKKLLLPDPKRRMNINELDKRHRGNVSKLVPPSKTPQPAPATAQGPTQKEPNLVSYSNSSIPSYNMEKPWNIGKTSFNSSYPIVPTSYSQGAGKMYKQKYSKKFKKRTNVKTKKTKRNIKKTKKTKKKY